MDANPSIMSHVSVGVRDVPRAAAFYDAVLATLGARRVEDHGTAVGYGRMFPEFWIGAPSDGGEPTVGRGTHFAFLAASRAEVDAFWTAALAGGATPDGPPGPREHYGPGYYACFVRDLDGHKIEAHCIEAP